MLRPLRTESFEDCRTWHLDLIKDCREMVKAVQSAMPKMSQGNKALAREVIADQQQIIKATYGKLKEMQRWWLREGQKNEGKRLLEETPSA